MSGCSEEGISEYGWEVAMEATMDADGAKVSQHLLAAWWCHKDYTPFGNTLGLP